MRRDCRSRSARSPGLQSRDLDVQIRVVHNQPHPIRWSSLVWIQRLRWADRCDLRRIENVRTIQVLLTIVGGAGSFGCILLPLLGLLGFSREFDTALSFGDSLRVAGPQLVGPVLMLSISLWTLLATARKRLIPYWTILIGLLAVFYTPQQVGGLSHDFSHAVFNQCSGIYGSFVLWLCVTTGLAFVGVWCLDSHRRRRGGMILGGAGKAPSGR